MTLLVCTLDEETINKIKACKQRRLPICLEKSLVSIFREDIGQRLLDKIVYELGLDYGGPIASSEQLFTIYDKALDLLAQELGDGVSKVIEFQSVDETEKMGCANCPLYRKRICKLM
jgi:hypothetical protein